MHLRKDILGLTLLVALSLNAFAVCERETKQPKSTKPTDPTKQGEQKSTDLLANIKRLKDAADVSKEVADWASALKYRLKVYDLYKKIHHDNPNHIDLAKSLTDLGEAYLHTQKDQKALDCYLQALEILRNAHKGKPYKAEIGTVLLEIGNLYSTMTNFTEAIKHYLEALEISRETDQPNSKEKADILDKLARDYKALNDLPNAIKYATESLEAQKNLHRYEPNHKDVRISLNLLLTFLRSAGQYEKALSYSKTWHEMVTKEFHETTLVAFSYYNLGFLYYKLNEYSKAIPNLVEARRIYPENDMDLYDTKNLAEVCFYLARCYSELSDYQPAIKYMTEALEMYQDINTNEDPGSKSYDITIALDSLGTYYVYSGNNKKGKAYFLEAVEYYEHLESASKYEIGIESTYGRLGAFASVESDHEEAIRYFLIAVDGFQKKSDDELVAFYLSKLVTEYMKVKKYADALRCGLKTLELQKKINDHDPNHPEIAIAHNSLAKVYIELGISEKALDHQRKAADMCSEFYFNEENNEFCVKALSSLGKMYSDMDDEDSALKYYSEAKRISGKFEEDGIVFHSRTPPKQDL